MQVIISEAEAFSRTVADWLVQYIRSVLETRPRCTLALSGGNTPKALYELLAQEPYRDQIEWHRLHIFWGDERAVPFESSQNNAGEAFRALLNHVPAVAEQVYPMQTDIAPDEAAARYETLLRTYFEARPTTFDLVLLGMGDDGHTLSLFPGTPVVTEEEAWVRAFSLEQQHMYRITLTAPVVNRAACVAFLVTGANKAGVLSEVLTGTSGPAMYPAQRIRPTGGELIWFVDKAAGRLLP